MNKNFNFRLRTPEEKALMFAKMEEGLLKQLKSKDGKCEQSLINLAQLYSQSGRVDEAFRCVEKLLELSDDPERHASYCLALGCDMEKINDYKGAVRFYRQALALEPRRAGVSYWIHNNLGYSLNQLQAYDDAMPLLRRAIEIDPQKPNAYKNLGLASQAIGHLEEAAKLFVRATQVDAADPRSLKHLEELMCARPDLEMLVPGLSGDLEACRKAVNSSPPKLSGPDFQAIWQRQHQDQEKAKSDGEYRSTKPDRQNEGRTAQPLKKTAMSNDQILEAQELSEDIRRDLQTILARTLRPDELLADVLEALPRISDSFYKLVRLRPAVFESESDYDSVNKGLAAMECVAESANRDPDKTLELTDAVKMYVHSIHSVLLKTEQALQTQRVDAPMTNEEILEAEQLIALVRADLCRIASTDTERLPAVVLDRVTRMYWSLGRQFMRRHKLISGAEWDELTTPLAKMMACADMAQRPSPDYTAKLVNAVAKQVPLVNSGLDKIEHRLKEPGYAMWDYYTVGRHEERAKAQGILGDEGVEGFAIYESGGVVPSVGLSGRQTFVHPDALSNLQAKMDEWAFDAPKIHYVGR